MNRDQALEILKEYTKSESLLKHAYAVEAGMRAYAEKYNEDVEADIRAIYGKAIGITSPEAIAEAIISVEGRPNYIINGPEFQDVDGISGYNLVAFLEGFCQGCKCTLRLEYSGKDPHHSWEAAFRAFGYALKNVFKKNEWRIGTISGLKGTLE